VTIGKTIGGMPASEHDKRFRIAFILTPVEFGGAEKVSLTFLKNFDRSRFQILPILFTRPWERENHFERKLKEENCAFFQVPVAQTKKGDYLRVMRCYRIVHRMLKDNSFDLIHTNGYFADIVGIPVARILGIPSISTCHGFISTDAKLKLYNKLDKIMLRLSDRIIAVSQGIKEDLIHNGIAGSRVAVIQNAVNGNRGTESFSQTRSKKRHALGLSEQDFVIGFVGRLSQEKGIEHLIHAAALLTNANVPVKLLLVGEGPQRNSLETLSVEKGVKDRVQFAGFQSDAESWLDCFDVFALPSLTEGTPMALLEAMSCGVPVVASAVGGVPYVIESGKNGILVSPGKTQDIKDAMHLLYKNKDLRNSLSKEAQRTIKMKYDVEDWINKIETEYLKVLDQ
jgi:glycosyltransferase involved in cell wall biosynthesis